MKNKKSFILLGIILLIIASIILIVNFNKREEMNLLSGQAFRYFNCQIDFKVKDGKIEYTINITPRYEDMKYEDVKIIFNISGNVNSITNNRNIMQPLKFDSEEITLNSQGIYKGIFIYADDDSQYIENNRNKLHLFVKRAEGKILK